jgi:hypothetical protein
MTNVPEVYSAERKRASLVTTTTARTSRAFLAQVDYFRVARQAPATLELSLPLAAGRRLQKVAGVHPLSGKRRTDHVHWASASSYTGVDAMLLVHRSR